MFYGQCNDCGERWELGTAPTCKCPVEALAKPDFWEGYVPEPVKPATEESSATQAQQALDKKAENARELGLDYEPAQHKYRRGDRLICLETEEYCVIHISGTDRQWVKFPDTHIGVYKNEQLAELFELLPKEIEIEQPAQQEPVAYLCENAVGHQYFRWKKPSSTYKPIALYTSPPAQRTWVGLTPEERDHIWNTVGNSDAHGDVDGRSGEYVMDAIEAKLKEKNSIKENT